jgi:hypothetical protein
MSTQLITRICVRNPLASAFIIEAVLRYAQEIKDMADKENDRSLIPVSTWKAVAEDIVTQLNNKD